MGRLLRNLPDRYSLKSNGAHEVDVIHPRPRSQSLLAAIIALPMISGICGTTAFPSALTLSTL